MSQSATSRSKRRPSRTPAVEEPKVEERQASAEPAPFQIMEIQPLAVGEVWGRVEDLIRQAINASPEYAKLETPQDVRDRCLAGDYTLWLIFKGTDLKAALVVSLTSFSRSSIFDINYCGGTEIDSWIEDFYNYTVERARNLGCRFVKIDGRYAWIKKLEGLGFKPVSQEFLLEI